MSTWQKKNEQLFSRMADYDFKVSDINILINKLEKDLESELQTLQIELLLVDFFSKCFENSKDNKVVQNQLITLHAESYEIFDITPKSITKEMKSALILLSCYLRICDFYLKTRNITKAAKFVEVLYKSTAATLDCSLRWRILNSYSRFHSLSDSFEKAHQLHLEALKVAEECNNLDFIKRSILNTAGSLVDKYEYSLAGEYFNRLLRMLKPGLEEDRIFYIAAFNNIGEMHLRQGSFDNALIFFEKKMALLQQSSDKDAMVGCYSDIGTIHQRKGYLNKAKNCYMRDFSLCEEVGNKFGSARAMANVGGIFLLQNKFDQAEECYMKSCKTAKDLGSYSLYHASVINLANIAVRKGMYDKALNYLLLQYKYCEDKGMFSEVLHVAQNIISIYLENEKFTEASEMIDKSWILAKSIKNSDLIIRLLFAKCTIAFEKKDFGLIESYIIKIAENLRISPNKQHAATMTFCQAKLYYRQNKFGDALTKTQLTEEQAIEIGMEDLVYDVRLLASQIRTEMNESVEMLQKEKDFLRKMLIGCEKEQMAEIYYHLMNIEFKIVKLENKSTSHDLTQFKQNCLKEYFVKEKKAPTYKVKKRLKELQAKSK